MSTTSIAAILGGLAALITALNTVILAFHGKSIQQTKVNVNGNLERFLTILSHAAITLPHATATKVISAPPPENVADDATIEERLAAEFFAKLKGTSDHAS